jgi:hypothetical protein
MKTFHEWLEAFIVGTDCSHHADFQVQGAQTNARGGKGCPNPPGSNLPLITGEPKKRKHKKSF